jgi:uncharacterized membrane protein
LGLEPMGATSSCSEFTCATRPDLHRLTSESTATGRWTLFRTTHDAGTVSSVLARITSGSSAHEVSKTARSGAQHKRRRSYFLSFRSQTGCSSEESSAEQTSEESARDGTTWRMLMVEECHLRLFGNPGSEMAGGSCGRHCGGVIALVLAKVRSAPVVRDRPAVASAPDIQRCLTVSDLRIVSTASIVEARTDSRPGRHGAIH